MEQKKREQDVLIVRDEKTGEIGVVAGLKRDGTPNMKPARAEHAQDFLRFDRHGDALDNFFANFYRQCKEPKRFGFYRVAVEGVENVVAVMKELLTDPVGFQDVLSPHKVDTTKYEQAAAQAQEPVAAEQKPPTEEAQQAERPEATPVEEKRAEQSYKPIDLDRLTNETVVVPVSAIRIPDEVKGVKLDPEQKAALSRGEGVFVEGMTGKSGKKFDATIQINADKRGLDFHFGGQRRAQRQEQSQASDDTQQPRRLRIGKSLLSAEVKPEYKAGWEQNKWVYIEGMTDKKGQKFNAYVRPNHEKVKFDFSRKRPEQSQIHEIQPDNASRTQVAVNSEGKTHEATKHVGEPLQRGQTAPANTDQQRRQQQAGKPKMRM